MKIGLLNAYSRENEASRSTSCLESFENFLKGLNAQILEFRVSENQFPEDLSDFDVFLLSGSAFGVYEKYNWIQRYKELIPKLISTEKKIVAVCFGHQLVAEALGGEVNKAPSGWLLGPNQFEIAQTKSFMSPTVDKPYFLFSNQDQVTQLPDNSELLAGSDECPNGIFLVQDQIFAMQFHPEFTTEMMVERIDKFKYSNDHKWLAETRAKTTEISVAEAEIKQWITNFINKS